MSCRYSHEASDYLTDDGTPCRRDDYGDPTHHCTARQSCSRHVGAGELTCARCIGRARANLRRIADLSALMLPAAIAGGVNSEAANLAGPAANPYAWSERRIAMGRHLDTWTTLGRITEKQHLHAIVAMPDDDEDHPYSVLGRWEMMLREDYGHPSKTRVTIASAAEYLGRQLHVMAQDDAQDFPLLARELRRCRNHLEAVIRNSNAPERGATCPECRRERPDKPARRLTRTYGHWCEDEDCEQIHFADDSGDIWRCPTNGEHWWNPQGYADMLQDATA